MPRSLTGAPAPRSGGLVRVARYASSWSAVLFALAASGCPRSEAPDAAPPAPSTSAAPPSPSSGPTTCAEGQRALEQHIVSGSSACTTDTDCACVDLPEAPPPLGRKDAFCNIVVPRDRVASLRAENDALASRGCAPQAACAPAACQAMCVPRPGGQGFCETRSRCREITVSADALVRRLERTCTKNEDCASYPAGIAQDCGGIANRASVAPLLSLAKEFHDASCPYSVSCAARRAFRPVCVAGMCGDAPPSTSP